MFACITLSSFLISNYLGLPVLVGSANQNGTCSESGCDGNTMFGDNKILGVTSLELDEEWKLVGHLSFSAAALGIHVCLSLHLPICLSLINSLSIRHGQGQNHK